MKPEISLIVATFNRSGPLNKLLNRLKEQTLPKNKWEVIVAVDGSSDDTEQVLEKWTPPNSLPLTWFYQENTGQALARHNAILKSSSSKIIVIDDDLNLSKAFIESHLTALNDADDKTVVIGKVVPNKDWQRRPLYELVREYNNMLMHQDLEKGTLEPTFEVLITQNVSFHKQFYIDVGGFDAEMKLGEDTEIGMRFEKAGGKFTFCKEAWVVHESNIGSYKTWIRRQYDYGKFAWMAWKKNDEDITLHPLANFVNGSKLNRWVVIFFVRSDFLTNVVVSLFRSIGFLLQKLNLIIPAIATHKAIISLKQHQGLKDVYGSWAVFRKAEQDYRLKLRQ
ncbi:glycosyltransferase [Candidatus Pacearchaeota archaeon]|nr:glycosyltransferase [Candidatus Pacearchaeota archaeon]